MAFSINPFSQVIENTDDPFARLKRTTFWEKIQDAFHVIAGNRGGLRGFFSHINDTVSLNDGGNIAYLGLLDYPTLGIAPIIYELTYWCWNNALNNPVAFVFFLPASLRSDRFGSHRCDTFAVSG